MEVKLGEIVIKFNLTSTYTPFHFLQTHPLKARIHISSIAELLKENIHITHGIAFPPQKLTF